MSTIVNYSVAPTGGVILIDITPDPSLNVISSIVSINRYTSSLLSSAVNIFSGSPMPLVFIDDGVNLPNFLDFSTTYYYTVTDPLGTYTSPPIVPSAELEVFGGWLDKLFFRLFSAGLSSVAIPAGYNSVRVLESMPLTPGSEATQYPFIVMNLDMEQQTAAAIGNAVPNPNEINLQILQYLMLRSYSLTLIAHTASQRDFYREASKSVLYSVGQVLTQIGSAVSIDYQCAQTQESDGIKMPGFYVAEMKLDIEGIFNVSIETNYPLISSIIVNVSGVSGFNGNSSSPSVIRSIQVV